MIFVSAGFDSCLGDPLGGLSVTQDTYCHITNRLSQLAGGRLIVALEGGYNFRAISLAAESVLRVFKILGNKLFRLSREKRCPLGARKQGSLRNNT